MKQSYKETVPKGSGIPPYGENAALQLIVITGVTYIAFHAARVVLLITGMHKDRVFHLMYSNFGLSDFHMYADRWWTIFSYGWVHEAFFSWLTNMIWLFCFASILQSIKDYRNVIPVFVCGLLGGGGCFAGIQFLFPDFFRPDTASFFTGSHAGIMAVAVAAVSLDPRYRVSPLRNLSFPLAVPVILFILLSLMTFLPAKPAVLILYAGGALAGFLYALLLKKGFRPGSWIYDGISAVDRSVNPEKKAVSKKKKPMVALHERAPGSPEAIQNSSGPSNT